VIDISCIPELEIDNLLYPLYSPTIHEVFRDYSNFCHVKMLRNCGSIREYEMNILQRRKNVFDVREFHGKELYVKIELYLSR
jgi:hypothetical protein